MHSWIRRCLGTVAVIALLGVGALSAGFGLQADAAGHREPDDAHRSPMTQRARRIWIDTDDRDAVIEAYEREFLASPPVLVWDGDPEACESGYSSDGHRQATLDRVNYYRAMAGVPAVVTEDPRFTAKAQDAALMMSVEGTLTHHPAETFDCFTVSGQQAAANSNLHLGRTGPAAIDGYIEDPGPKNIDVGHRNTVLHPPTRTMGIGDVAASSSGHAANVLWVFDERVFDETSVAERPSVREPHRFVAWPPRGYVPPELVFPRWSFTMAGADFTNADVALYRPSAPPGQRRIALSVVDRVGAAGHVPLPTIVWEPEIDAEPEHDQSFLVVVSDVDYFDNGLPTRADQTSPGPVWVAPPPARPTSFAYTVRVVGRAPVERLSTEGFLASVARMPRT